MNSAVGRRKHKPSEKIPEIVLPFNYTVYFKLNAKMFFFPFTNND